MHKDMPCGMKTTIDIPTTAVAFVGASPYRHGIVVMPPTAGTCCLTFDSYDGDGLGIMLNTGDEPTVICACKYGNIVTKPWFIEQTTGRPGNVNRLPVYTWRNAATATGSDATITIPNPGGQKLWLTTVSASTDGNTDTGEITVDDGTTTLFSGWCNEKKSLYFYDPTGNGAADGEAITGTYSNSAAGVNASIYIAGYSIYSTPQITFYELAERPDDKSTGGNRPSQYYGSREAFG